MNSVELLDKKNQLKIKADSILSGAERESGKLNEKKQSKFEALKNEIKDVENEIRDLTSKLNKKKTKRKKERHTKC